MYIYIYVCDYMWLYVFYLCLALQQSQLVLQQSEWQQQSRLLNCPTFQLSHAASNGLEQFMENPELPTDQGLFLAFIGLELTQNGLNMSAWCWRRMENGQSRQGMSGGYLSVVWHLFESTTRDKQWTLETSAGQRRLRARDAHFSWQDSPTRSCQDFCSHLRLAKRWAQFAESLDSLEVSAL